VSQALFVVAGLALAGVACELAARWWVRRRSRYYVLPPGLRIKSLLDPEALPQLNPTARFEVNSDGERGGEVPKPPRGLYRVLVAGGSVPEAFFLDQDASWTGLLQRILERPRHLRTLGAAQVHVGCIARSGVGSEALDMVFEKTLPQYRHLELIVIMVGVNDVMRWFEQNTPVKPSPVRAADVFRCNPEAAFGWSPRRLALRELARRARIRWLRPVDVHERSGQWLNHARAMRARAKTVRDTVPDPSPMLMHFEHHFRRLLQRAHDHADRVLVIRQPWFRRQPSAQEALSMWHGGVGQAWREEITTYYSFAAFTQVMSLLDERVAEITTELGVESLDLTPTLEQSLDTYYDGLHVTSKGARQIALAVSAAVLTGSRRPVSAPAAPQRAAYSTREAQTATSA
jgi:lysophospholipase L1-like esterase